MDAGPSILHTPASGQSANGGPHATPPRDIDHGRFPPGTIVQGRYRIVGRLGFGGMGVLYRADDLKLQQPVALKFLALHAREDAGRVQRFLNEVRVARTISHQNVCRVYDVGEFENQAYISMEFVDGEDLAALLRRIGRLPHAKALDIAHQLCAGLHAAHQVGVVHRDLKPANIMLDSRGQVRITDFGLAALTGEISDADARAGTPAYMSPEQIAGHDVGPHSDIYSLGLVLYELFTGGRAFPADSLTRLRDLQTRLTTIQPRLLAEKLDKSVTHAILRCLDQQPAQRPRSALSVARGLPGGEALHGPAGTDRDVALSPQAEGVEPAVAFACLVVTLIGLSLFPMLSDQVKLHGLTPLPKSPEVLSFDARGLLNRCGQVFVPIDTAAGFEVDRAYLNWIERTSRDKNRWNRLVLEHPPSLTFWYRESPRHLIPPTDTGRVSPTRPPFEQPGMGFVRFDASGRLLSLRIVAPDASPPLARKADWTPVIQAAQLSRSRFVETEPLRTPPVFCDEVAAWRGSFASTPEVQVEIEAGALAGRIVYFETFYRHVDRGEFQRDQEPEWQFAAHIAQGLLLGVAALGGILVARRNLQLGRGDQDEALRVAGLIAVLMLFSWLLQADHAPDVPSQISLAIAAAGRALLLAAAAWLFYVALEPHVHRGWPEMLISWKRLLDGRWRDSLVGRDIITGAVFGIFAMIVTAARYFGPLLANLPSPPPGLAADDAYLGLRYELAVLGQLVSWSILIPLVLLVVLLMFLLVFRVRWAALAAFGVIATVAPALLFTSDLRLLPFNLAYCGLMVGALIFVLLRFGLLALIFALLFALILETYPITADLNVWYSHGTIFAMVVAGGLAFYGFVVAMGDRPLIRADLIRT